MNPPDDEELEPAGPEEFQWPKDKFAPALLNLLKNIAEQVGHSLLKQEDTIYQYTTIEGLHGMVTGNSLWTTPLGYLNDASEFRHGQELFQRVIKEFIAHPEDGDWKEVLLRLLLPLRQSEPNHVFVTCFAPNGDQLSQWRGYAADGHGYAVGFDTTRFNEIKPDPLVLNVLYQEDKQRRFCEELMQQGTVETARILEEAGIQPRPEAVAELLFFAIHIMLPGFKHEGFAEEREVRIFLVIDYDAKATKGVLYKERKGLLVPHIPLKWQEGKLPIREIIVGPNLNFEQAEWSLKRFLEQNGYRHVEIKRSAVPYLA